MAKPTSLDYSRIAMVAPRALTHLGTLPVADFMRRYWQRRPLLIRHALPGLRSPVSREELFALARRDEVESRLVTAFDGHWRLKRGPLARLPAPHRPAWTLLVQGVEMHVPAAADLLRRFRFIPDARLDDLMVSYASDGGGVGPHVDSYDVFLIQAHGRRRWRIGRQRHLWEVPGLPLRILADFRPTADWVLNPGDLLYLPPNVAHEGTAVGTDCITCSIGFRAPRLGEIAERWFDALAAAPMMAAQRRDPELRPTRRPGRLPPAMLAAEWDRLRRLRPRRADAALALLAVLSEPKPSVVFTAPRRPPAATRAQGVALDPRSRLLYSGDWIGINGETGRMPTGARRAIRALADRRRLTPAEYATQNAATRALLAQWLTQGWLRLD